MLKRCKKSSCIALAISILLAFASPRMAAQTDPQLSQYWAMPTFYNPAAVGNSDYINVHAAGKMQWLGIENAPKGIMGAADMPFKLLGKRMGVGVTAMTESLGLFNNIDVNAQLGYKFKFLKGQLGIGVQGGYFSQKFKGSEVVLPDNDDYHQGTDEAIPTQDMAGHAFDIGAGLWYQHKYFFIGAGAQHILEPEVRLNIDGTEQTETQEFYTKLPRVFYFTGGGNIAIKNSLFELQPSFMVKTDFNSFTAEVNAMTIYNKFLMIGLGYRWQDAINLTVGAQIKDFYIGYTYDYPLSAIAKASSGSHEIVAGYRFKLDFTQKNKNRHRSIRLM